MPAKNQKQLNLFLLIKAYKEYGEIGVRHKLSQLQGYKPRLTPAYMDKLAKTAKTIKDSDLLDLTSGIEGDNVLGDKKELKVGYWALFKGQYKKDGLTQDGEFIAQIKRVDNNSKVVNFSQKDFKNKYGQNIIIPRRANISNPDHIYLDYALFDNVIKTGKSPMEIAQKRENLEESIRKIIQKIFLENFQL